ncbi:MAG TPA: DMT family transporter [Chthoniobacterales bacterium]|jgi:drug/metabolite transporter (DMT)-like permease
MKQSDPIARPGRVPSSRQINLPKGYAAVLATVVIWSLPSLFQFYLNRFYDPWSQNFYRYGVACLAIVPFVLVQFRRGPKIDIGAVVLCLIPCLPNVVHQITQVIALFYMGPGVYAIFIRSSVIFSAVLALVLFPEEREVIRQWQFQLGTILGLAGAFGVIWFQSNGQDRHIALPGLFVAFTASFCWALYATLIKRPSARLGPIRSFGVVSVITSALLLPLMFAFGKAATPLQVGANVNLILIISAVICITLAHVLYYIAIREIGVALAQSLQLLCPLAALGLSALIFHERINLAQSISALVLLIGAFLAMRTKPVAMTEAAENI